MTMTDNFAQAGDRGPKVRSDIWIGMTQRDSGGVTINLKSKIETMFGDAIRKQIDELVSFFELENITVELEDTGAVPYVISARFEAVVRKLGLDNGKRYIPENPYNIPVSLKDRFRRSRLYLPGNTPKFFLNASLHGADGLILDLEDSVSPRVKDDARIMVRNALCRTDFKGAERMVRINQGKLGLEDLEEILPQQVDLILIPKVETSEQIKLIDAKVDEILKANPNTRDVFYMPIIESALGVINSYSIATASQRTVALAIGLEDYTADLGVQRSVDDHESFYARSMLVNAARAAGLQPIDTVFSDVSDMDALLASVQEAKSLGFDGKGCIHPRQIRVIHEGFAPTESEIRKATRIVLAFESAEKKGHSVVSLGNKMIDPPVVKRALHTVKLALKGGLLAESWRTDNE